MGAYPILQELGRGGMGVVYRARDSRLERDVALKLLPLDPDADSKSRQHFLDEARTLAALNHPNIATIFSLEDHDGRHFLTMELVEGVSLWEHLAAGAPPLDETLALMRQVARALEAAHSKGVVHRDLKPSNVMVRRDGTVKVLDFGLAVRLQAGAAPAADAPAAAGRFGGTPGYMSPEQVRGEAVDPRADVWAMGCVLYECLAGRPLIRGDSVSEKLTATMAFDTEPMLDAGGLAAGLPARLALLLQRCLAPQAADRFASMREVRILIEEEIAERALPRAAEAAPAAAARPAQGNLPRRPTSFVGRRRDMEETARLLEENRMVTITGAGGCGKTRLSLELAGRPSRAFPDGVWLVELAALSDPALVPASAAAALGVKGTPGSGALEVLLQFLAPKRLLLVLDNCEHLVDACADLARHVIEACPHVRLLATSRESLRVEGEAVYALAPLSLPAPGPSASRAANAVDGSEAVRLFVDRARAMLPEFHLGDANRAAVHEICRRLDGIPLALELAAARVKTLPVAKIRELLDDRFRLLTRGSRTAQPHQATLRALIDWSYDRLDSAEQAVFRRLSVFCGAWTLDAVEAVAAGGDVLAWEALDLFTRLVEKSLVVRDAAVRADGSARYYMLETVRTYAREKLQASPEEERAALRRYRDYIVALSIEGELGLRGREQAAWGVRLADVLDDVRAVLDMVAVEPDGAEAGLLLAGSYWLQWSNRGMWQEGGEALARALAHPGADRDSAPCGKAMVAAGNMAYRMGEYERSKGLYQDALAVLLRAGSHHQIASAYMNLGNIGYVTGETTEAEKFYETSLEYFRRAGSTVWIAGCLTNISVIALTREDIDRVESMQTEALQIYEAAGIRDQMCLCLFQLGIAAHIRGEHDLSRARFDRALGLAREIDHNWIIMAALENSAATEVSRDRIEEGRRLVLECLERLKDMRDPIIAVPVVETAAGLIAAARPADSARLLGAAIALRSAFRIPGLPYELRALSRLEANLKTALGDAELARARDAGASLSLEAALAAAGELLEPPC